MELRVFFACILCVHPLRTSFACEGSYKFARSRAQDVSRRAQNVSRRAQKGFYWCWCWCTRACVRRVTCTGHRHRDRRPKRVAEHKTHVGTGHKWPVHPLHGHVPTHRNCFATQGSHWLCTTFKQLLRLCRARIALCYAVLCLLLPSDQQQFFLNLRPKVVKHARRFQEKRKKGHLLACSDLLCYGYKGIACKGFSFVCFSYCFARSYAQDGFYCFARKATIGCGTYLRPVTRARDPSHASTGARVHVTRSTSNK